MYTFRTANEQDEIKKFEKGQAPRIAEKVTFGGLTLEDGDVLKVGSAKHNGRCYTTRFEIIRKNEVIMKGKTSMKPYTPETPVFWVDNKPYIYDHTGNYCGRGKPFVDQWLCYGSWQFNATECSFSISPTE